MGTSAANKAAVIRFNKEFIENGNMNSFDEIISKDFINHTAPENVPKGPEGVLYFFNHFLKPAFPDLKVDILDQVSEGEKVTTRKTFTGTHAGSFLGIPPTHKKIVMDVIDIIKLRDGKFIEHWNVLDWQSVLHQLSNEY